MEVYMFQDDNGNNVFNFDDMEVVCSNHEILSVERAPSFLNSSFEIKGAVYKVKLPTGNTVSSFVPERYNCVLPTDIGDFIVFYGYSLCFKKKTLDISTGAGKIDVSSSSVDLYKSLLFECSREDKDKTFIAVLTDGQTSKITYEGKDRNITIPELRDLVKSFDSIRVIEEFSNK